MKTTLTLSAVLFSLTLAPAALADGAQEQKQADTPTVAYLAPEAKTTTAAPTITRSVLQALDLQLRDELLASLRDSALGLLQAATPALVETTVEAARELTAR